MGPSSKKRKKTLCIIEGVSLSTVTQATNEALCDLCGANSALYLWSKGRYGVELNNVICRGCGLIYVHPQPTKAEIDKFYKDKEFTIKYRGVGRDIDAKIHQRSLVAEEWHKLIDGALLNGSGNEQLKILEVGSGIGAISGYFANAGFSVTAIEPDPSFISSAAERWPHVKYIQTDFDDYYTHASSSGESFDCILMIHMLEHVPSPRETLVKIRNLLDDDGIIAIEVPCAERPYGVEGLDFFFMLPHLYTFSIGTLSSYLNTTGYNILDAHYSGSFLRMLAQKGERNNIIEREDAILVKERLISWHRRQRRMSLVLMLIGIAKKSRWSNTLFRYVTHPRRRGVPD